MPVLKQKKVKMCYYALLREQRGLSQEDITTKSNSLQDLYKELQQKYSFKLPLNILRVSVNNRFVPWTTKIKSNDQIIFIPPVAGG